MADRIISPTAWAAPAATRVSIALTTTGADGSVATISPENLVNNYAVRSQDTKTLAASGNTAITVPTNAQGVLIILPTTNTDDIVVKGATSGDAGFIMSAVGWCLLTFKKDAPPATININKAGAGTLPGVQLLWF